MTKEGLDNLISDAQMAIDTPFRPLIALFGEGIRQLTRIADQGELRIALTDEPASPDALVEAVKGTLKGMSYIINNPMHLEDNIKHWQRRLKKGLADHEKAVR